MFNQTCCPSPTNDGACQVADQPSGDERVRRKPLSFSRLGVGVTCSGVAESDSLRRFRGERGGSAIGVLLCGGPVKGSSQARSPSEADRHSGGEWAAIRHTNQMVRFASLGLDMRGFAPRGQPSCTMSPCGRFHSADDLTLRVPEPQRKKRTCLPDRRIGTLSPA